MKNSPTSIREIAMTFVTSTPLATSSLSIFGSQTEIIREKIKTKIL